jgi:hypothetical protein
MLSAHQPCYIPWLGFFDKLLRADKFVLLDDVQFATGPDNYVNRNRIKTPRGVEWLTIPLLMGGHLDKTIGEMQIATAWRAKHLGKLKEGYLGAPYADLADWVLPPPGHNLADVAGMSVCGIADMIFPEVLSRIETQSELEVIGHKTDLIVNLCKATNERSFLFGGHGRDYADLDMLRDHGIEAVFQEYHCPVYPQMHGAFVPNLSIVDALLNVGVEGTRRLLCP